MTSLPPGEFTVEQDGAVAGNRCTLAADSDAQAGAGDLGAEGALGHEHPAGAKVPDNPEDYRRS